MTEEDNLKVIEGVDNALRAEDWEAWGDLHAENVAHHSPDRPEAARGREAVGGWYRGWFRGFPDLDVKPLRTFGQGDWVVREYAVSGTHTGPFPGPKGESIPPTNRRIEVPFATLFRVEGGQVTEVHEYFDQLSLLAQLGLMELP